MRVVHPLTILLHLKYILHLPLPLCKYYFYNLRLGWKSTSVMTFKEIICVTIVVAMTSWRQSKVIYHSNFLHTQVQKGKTQQNIL